MSLSLSVWFVCKQCEIYMPSQAINCFLLSFFLLTLSMYSLRSLRYFVIDLIGFVAKILYSIYVWWFDCFWRCRKWIENTQSNKWFSKINHYYSVTVELSILVFFVFLHNKFLCFSPLRLGALRLWKLSVK